MGIFDMFKRHKGDDAGGTGTALRDRVTGMMSGHSDKVNQGLDRAGRMADEKTGGKYTNQINTGVGKAKDALQRETQQGSGGAGSAGTETPYPEQGPQGGGSAEPPQSPPQS